MKKKIAIMLLLILAGMWIILSQNGWCLAKYPGRTPWDDVFYATRGGDEPDDENANLNIENSPFINISIFEVENLLRRGDKSLDNFQQKQGNSGQVK